jgi:hypothetical protein
MEERKIRRGRCIIKEYDIRFHKKETKLGVRKKNLVFHKGDETTYIKYLVLDMNRSFHMDELPTEEGYCVAYSDSYEPIGLMQLSHGTEDMAGSVAFYIALFLKLLRARYYVTLHNHPSTDGYIHNEFSSADVLVRQKARMLTENCGVNMLNDVVIYKGGYIESGDKEESREDIINFLASFLSGET